MHVVVIRPPKMPRRRPVQAGPEVYRRPPTARLSCRDTEGDEKREQTTHRDGDTDDDRDKDRDRDRDRDTDRDKDRDRARHSDIPNHDTCVTEKPHDNSCALSLIQISKPTRHADTYCAYRCFNI